MSFRKWLNLREGLIRLDQDDLDPTWWSRVQELCREVQATTDANTGPFDEAGHLLRQAPLDVYQHGVQTAMMVNHSLLAFAAYFQRVHNSDMERRARDLSRELVIHANQVEGRYYGMHDDDFCLLSNYSLFPDRGQRIPPNPMNYSHQYQGQTRTPLWDDVSLYCLRIHEGNYRHIPGYVRWMENMHLDHPGFARDLTCKAFMVEAFLILRALNPDRRIYLGLIGEPFDADTWSVAADWMEDNGADGDFLARLRRFIKANLEDDGPRRTPDGFFHWGPGAPWS